MLASQERVQIGKRKNRFGYHSLAITEDFKQPSFPLRIEVLSCLVGCMAR